MSASTPVPTDRRVAAVGHRLPWWSVVLPAVAFAVLLLLIAGPGQAHAVTVPSDGQGLAHLVYRLLEALPL